jgi:septal ring factor EnvC (AmiA/AmiB activator)
MNNLKTLLLSLALMTLFCLPGVAQVIPSYIPAESAPVVVDSTEQVIARLSGEVTAGRALVATQKEQIVALDAQLAAERANGTSLSKSYADAQREVVQLRAATAALERAITLHERSIAILDADRERAVKEAKKQRRRATLATLAAIGSVVLRFL